MKGFVGDIEMLTEGNADFRRVLYTAKHPQVLMTLPPGEQIGEGVHTDRDQFFRGARRGRNLDRWCRNQGQGRHGDDRARGSAPQREVHGSRAPEALHDIRTPEHVDATVHATKQAAETAEEHFDGKER
jgi:hypothetical protein